jgi:hypothetical protein
MCTGAEVAAASTSDGYYQLADTSMSGGYNGDENQMSTTRVRVGGDDTAPLLAGQAAATRSQSHSLKAMV